MKVLVVATNWWDLGGRIAISLARAGFDVAELSPPASALHKLRSTSTHYVYWPWRGASSILAAIDDFKPEYIVSADDEAVAILHRLHACMRSYNKTNRRASSVCALIERSLGDPQSYALLAFRSKFMHVAQTIGVRCPRAIFVGAAYSLDSNLAKATYPIVVKADHSYGGRGIRLANDPAQLRTFVNRLAFSHTWPAACAQVAYGLTLTPLIARALRRKRFVTLQEFISGRNANRAVVCLAGRVLAGISVEVINTRPRNGPAILVQTTTNREMAETATLIVKKLNLSGFHGFDFIIDSTGRAWLLELNPRVTPVSALAIEGYPNLATALFGALVERQLNTEERQPEPEAHHKIALYSTAEFQKDEKISPYFDASWNEPEFLKATSDGHTANFMDAILSRGAEFFR